MEKNVQNLIDSIYDKTIDCVTRFFDEEEKPEMIEAYKNYLVNVYGDFSFENKNRSYEEMRNILIKLQFDKWKNINKMNRQRMLLNDSAFEKLVTLSNFARENAEARLKGQFENISVTPENVSDYREQLKENLKNVREFNQIVAEQEVSESLLDLDYACFLSDYMSFRINELYHEKNR